MLTFILRRVLAVIPLVVIATAATFFMLQLSDVDPAVLRLADSATEEQYDEVRAELGTDRPAVVQYVDWLSHAARFDFGESWKRPVPVNKAGALPWWPARCAPWPGAAPRQPRRSSSSSAPA